MRRWTGYFVYWARRRLPTSIVTPIDSGYIDSRDLWEPWRPFKWRFDLDGKEMLIVNNDQVIDGYWSVYMSNRLFYKGNYSSMMRMYPYLLEYIDIV